MTYEPKLVRQIMSTRLITVSPDDNLGVAVAKVADHGVHRLPVVREISGEAQLVGMISDRDLRLASDSPYFQTDPGKIIEQLRAVKVSDVMTGISELVTVFPGAPVAAAAQLMLDNRVGGLPVVEHEHGRPYLVGIITRTDILEQVIRLEKDRLPDVRLADPIGAAGLESGAP